MKQELEMKKGFVLPLEIADKICLTSLKDHRDYLKSELKQWRKNPKTEANPKGYWLHPEDVGKNKILIQHMNAIIDFYGG